jgi:hypothetical protein
VGLRQRPEGARNGQRRHWCPALAGRFIKGTTRKESWAKLAHTPLLFNKILLAIVPGLYPAEASFSASTEKKRMALKAWFWALGEVVCCYGSTNVVAQVQTLVLSLWLQW